MAAVANSAPAQQAMPAGGEDLFEGKNKIMIKQEFAMLEMCGVEAKNRYRITVPEGENEGKEVFLYIDEESKCLERICCKQNRTLTLKVHQGSSKDGPVVQSMHKPFHLQGCICCRPTFQVYGGDFDSKTKNPASGVSSIGAIKDPWRCCKMDQQIYDAGGKQLYNVYGSILQPGLCCPCCCAVDFSLSKGAEKQSAPGDTGTISKRPLTCAEICGKTNRFTVDFPPNSTGMEKRLILAGAMLLDLQYFEQKENNK